MILNVNFYKTIEKEMISLEINLRKVINSDIRLATEVASYLLESGGKRIRPILTILTARALGYRKKEIITLACAIELLHTATLIHDDVVDRSELRRGKESVQKKWDNAHGVLVGDFIYSKAFQLMSDLNNTEIIKILAESTNKISEGEVLQLALKGGKIISENEYFEIIERKTAELFMASAVSAALLSKASKRQINVVKEFSYCLGIAFQIRDDLLDYIGKESKTGKRTGKDFEEGKITLPLIKALEDCSLEEAEFIKSAIVNKKSKRFEEVKEIIKKSGALRKAQETVNQYSLQCLKELRKLPESKYRDSLEIIVKELSERVI